MEIIYKNKKLEKICKDASFAKRVYGEKMAQKIQFRIDEIIAADCLDILVKFKIGRCHMLSGKLKGLYSIDLIQPWRLLFSIEKILDKEIVMVKEILDYH